MSGYKIYRFTAEHVNGLKVVEITPKGESVQLTGRVAAGKTSVIDSLLQTFQGGLVLKEGEESGSTEVDLTNGEAKFRIRRSVKASGRPTLEVLTGNGFDMRVTQPSDFLKALVGQDVAISPTLFIQVKGGGTARKQILFDALGIDTSTEDEKIASLKERRTLLFHDITRIREDLRDSPVDPDLPKEPYSSSELMTKLNDANERNRDLAAQKEKIARDSSDYEKDVQSLREDHEEILSLEQRLKTMKDTYNRRREQIQEVGQQLLEKEKELQSTVPIDTADLEDRIYTIDQQNEEIRSNNKKREDGRKLDEWQNAYHELGQEANDVEGSKQAKLDKAMPVPGLTIGEDDVYWQKDGEAPVPGSKWSTGESVYLGCAVRVAQGDKSELKVVFVDDVSLLDVGTLEKMRELLGDYQVFEVHNTLIGEPVNVITIEEGEVKQDE